MKYSTAAPAAAARSTGVLRVRVGRVAESANRRAPCHADVLALAADVPPALAADVPAFAALAPARGTWVTTHALNPVFAALPPMRGTLLTIHALVPVLATLPPTTGTLARALVPVFAALPPAR